MASSSFSMLFKVVLLIGFLAVATAHKKKSPPGGYSTAPSAVSPSPSAVPPSPSDASASSPLPRSSSGDSTGSKVFDVTKYSASTSASASANSKAFTDAFKAACTSKGGRSTVLVPSGTYQLGPVKFGGPCPCAHITFEIQGTLVAPPDVKAFSGPSWIEFDALHELAVEGGGVIDGQGKSAWPQSCKNKAISMRFMRCVTGVVNNLTFKNSKFFHIALHHSQGMVLENLKIVAPCNSKNTDGIHLSSSSNIALVNLDIGTGDDCISIGPGTFNVTIKDSKCGPGHGFSVGSLGKYPNEANVGNIHVSNCSITGTSNGLRIKTWPGAPPSEAFNITFEDVSLNNVSYPIIIDQNYCPNGECSDSKKPSQVKLRDITFCRIKGTSNTPVAVKLDCSEKAPCQNVNLQDISLQPLASVVPKISSLCSNVLGSVKGAQKPDPCLGSSNAGSSATSTTTDASTVPSAAPAPKSSY